MKTIVLVVLAFSYLGPISKAQVSFEWVQRASLPAQGRWGAFTFEIDGYGYVAGGNAGGEYFSDVWRYDPMADEWLQVASMPGGRSHGASWSIDGKGYVTCGHVPGSFYSNTLWEFDPVQNEWNTKASLPSDARYGPYGFAIAGAGYVGGGNIGSASGPFLSDLWMYDPDQDQWTNTTGIPGPARYGSTGFVIGNKAYVHGGRESSMAFTTELWEFDPTTQSWTSVQSMPGPGRSWMMVMPFNIDAVVAGGADNGVITYEAYNYHPSQDTWTQIPDYPGASGWSGASFRLWGRPFGGLGWTIEPSDEHHNDWWELVKVDQTSIGENGPVAPLFTVFPNPVHSYGRLMTSTDETDLREVEISICDMTGREVFRTPAARSIEMNGLSTGSYILKFAGQRKVLYEQRLFIVD